MTHAVESGGGGTVRSRSGMRSAALLFGILALALGGCGTLPANLGGRLHLSLLGTDAPHARPPTPSSVAAPVEAEPVASPTITAAAVTAESRAETSPTVEPPADGASTDAPRATFAPVAFEPMPAERSSSLLAFAGRSHAEPPLMLAQTRSSAAPPPDAQIAEYDPWEPYNEKMFRFNYSVDRYVLKPVAKGYNFVMPDLFQQMIGNAFQNINVVPKLANNVLQWNWKGFSTELGRFLINSTLGIGGLFDIAKQEFGLEKTMADFGQTLGKWGLGPGPYVIVPLLPPLTVRDGVGYGVDLAMDPLTYVLPFIWDRFGMTVGNMVNDRSLNLDLFQGIEESTLDLYSSVRNGYLQRRENLIRGTR
jgi:phospholipid-binding lipoprotein MlaA